MLATVLFVILTIILLRLLILDKRLQEIRINNKRRVMLLMVSPILALVILFCFILSVHTIPWTRFSHAIFVLGLWTSVLLIVLKILYRKAAFYDGIPILLLFGMIIYFTPIYHYENFFSTISFIVPFVFGLLFILTYYVHLYVVKKKYSSNI